MANRADANRTVDELLTNDIAADDATQARRARNKVGLIALLLVIAAVGAMIMSVRLVQDAGDRDLLAWQVRLGIVADSRASALGEWVETQAGEIADIAANPSVALTMTELAMADGERARVADFDGQAAYLRSYLTSVAERAGFAVPRSDDTAAANSQPKTSGIAVVDRSGGLVAATRFMPPIEGALAEQLHTASRDAPTLIDAYLTEDGPRVGFIAPIYRLQMPAGADNFVGMVVGLRPLDAGFMALLTQPGATEATVGTMIVRSDGRRIEVVASTAEDLSPLTYAAEADDESLALAQMFDDPDGFVAGIGHTGTDVLASVRPIPGTDWLVAYRLDRDEALAESDTRQIRLLVMLLLMVALAVGVMVALWRHGASLRATHAANRYHAVAERMARQERFLRLVTDTQPSAMFVTDADGTCRYANQMLARRLDVGLSDIVGASLTAIFGREVARDYSRAHDDALAQNGMVALRRTVETADKRKRVVQALHVPMKDVSPEFDGAVLTVEEDITELMAERERNNRNLQKLVDTLVTIIDARDPFAAQHSVRVGMLAEMVAREMVVDEIAIATARISGTLLNLGKILVPSELLTSHRNLADTEMRTVRESILAGADLLEGVAFDGPVAETVRQAQERFDGGGIPQGLAGDKILLPARIVTVANAFVALVSARAHRPGMDIDHAVAHIQKDMGTVFDRSVVSALVNVLDNRGGRALVAEWAEASGPVASEAGSAGGLVAAG